MRLSSYTAAKQKEHRRGQQFKVTDYVAAAEIISSGTIVLEGRLNAIAMGHHDGSIWRSVFKRTKREPHEVYLSTLHRSKPKQIAREKRTNKVVRD